MFLRSFPRLSHLSQLTRTLRPQHTTPLRTICTSTPPPSNIKLNTQDEEIYEDHNQLEGKRTRDEIHSAFSLRSQDAVRYDYFAQRAEMEAEFEAASAFRALRETSKQQAMGYLELMEEYGDANFGGTVDNLEMCAANEREYAENLHMKAAGVAAEDELVQVEEWFEDMAAASGRAAARLDLVGSMIDAEEMDDEVMEEGEDDEPEKVKN